MVSNNLEDYEVLSILGADLNSTCYKVKEKTTNEVFVWKAISYEGFTESKKSLLLSQIDKRKLFEHPHLLKVYDYILHEDSKILYLVSEFCGNGNLQSLVQKCLIENEVLSEDFLWRILYQIACCLKIKGNPMTSLSLNNIFIDADYKVKLFNDNILNLNEKPTEEVCFGQIMFELCTLQAEKIKSVMITKQFLTEFPNYYSNELKEIIKFVTTANIDTKILLDTILCHPTILLKVQTKIIQISIKNPLIKSKKHANLEIESFRSRLENLKNRETALKIREEKLSEMSYELHKREKKIALNERMVKEKMLQAELYLKRSREAKSSTSSGSNKSTSTKISYENIDTSFSANSTFIAPTSNRLFLQGVKKPNNFIRTMSDRRVRFKGHSPLRNNFKEPRALPQYNFHPIKETGLDKSAVNLGEAQKKSRKKLDLFSVLPIRSRKPLVEVPNNIIYEETENGNNVQYECRPISWTEENKQQAFELLRIMNKGDENEVIKHTYL